MKKRSVSTRHYRSTFHLLLIGLVFSLVFGIFTIFRITPECANSISCTNDLSGTFDASQTTAIFLNQDVSIPVLTQEQFTERVVLGATDVGNKRIYIDLTNQRLFAKEGDVTVMEFPISSGKWGKTPTGDFTVWIKLRHTKMEGGSRALGTYYYLPNVPYTMYFYNDKIPKWRGFGIHGAYWHNNFGNPMSHGCINMHPSDAEKVYNWSTPVTTAHTTYASDDNPGTPITIYGTARNY